MSSLEEVRSERLKKLNILKEKEIEAYPISCKRDVSTAEAVKGFTKLKSKKKLHLAGRVMTIRAHGGSIFFDINDGSGGVQGYIKKDEIGDEKFSLFEQTVDMGDFLELQGQLFLTKRKEKTLLVSDWKMLAKSLRPMPDKFHGLQDVEERFRKRYLDLLSNEEVKNRFILRSKIITEIRSFLNENDYLEVETPVLQSLAGGASAQPFLTHHNTLDMDLYLRIAPELYLKKLLIGGFQKVYELGRNFRNEGIDMSHNPEFTMLEFYEAYADAPKQRDFVEKLLKAVIKKIFKKTSVVYQEQTVDFSKKFTTISYGDLFKKHILISNPETATREDFSLKAKQFGIDFAPSESKEKIMDGIFKKLIRPKLIQPTFVIDYPVNYLPLAKKIEGSSTLVDAFQLYAGGLELGKAFSELNDPIDQAERFANQEKERAAGDTEAQPSDKEFIEAMEQGMPPAGGVGIGIDRLTIFLTNTPNIREVILFPTLRTKENDGTGTEKQ
jgi:lysyl-tRNA synthetase class 2